MKRKFFILTLCFTIILSSINLKKSYADSGLLSVPMLATVSSLAVASGLVFNSDSHIYDLGRGFYDYVNKHNDLTWDTLKATFYSGVTVLNNSFISVDSKFLDVVKCFLNDTFDPSYAVNLGYVSNIPVFNGSKFKYIPNFYSVPLEVNQSGGVYLPNNYSIGFKRDSTGIWFAYYSPTSKLTEAKARNTSMNMFILYDTLSERYYLANYNDNGTVTTTGYLSDFSLSHITGTLNWDNVESKKENDKSIALPIPGNLGQLVGQGSADFWDNTDNLVGTGDITVPNVDNPSIDLDVDDTISFPTVGDVPDVDVPDVDVPDVDVPGNDIVVPSFPNFGDSLDFSPMYLTNVTEKFPFSLPWDIGRLIQRFDVDPVAPVFDISIFSETITLDLTEFDELAAIVKFFVLIGFILSLIFISTKLLG